MGRSDSDFCLSGCTSGMYKAEKVLPRNPNFSNKLCNLESAPAPDDALILGSPLLTHGGLF